MNLKAIEHIIAELEVDLIDFEYNFLLSKEPDDRDLVEWEDNRRNVELPNVEEKIEDFKKEFDSNFKREHRASYLNDLCEPIHREISRLEGMKKRHGKMFVLEEKLKDLKKKFKRYYLEYGIVKVDVKTEGYESQDIERCRLVPIESLIKGESMNAGHGRKRMLCPFHNEKTGSFFIFPDNHYHCFGCQAHGNNAVSFIIKLKDFSFKEALDYLSRF